MGDLVEKAGLSAQFEIASAATSTEEIGNPVYPPARRKLAEHGIPCESHAARQLRNHDYEEYDLLIGWTGPTSAACTASAAATSTTRCPC